jgi:type I restriction enzyme S subunit
MSFPRYPKYKASGVEWLGEVPEGWEVSRIKWLGKTVTGGTPKTEEPAYWIDGDVPWLPSGKVQNNTINQEEADTFITKKALAESAAKLIRPGSALIALTGATCANAAYLTFESTANQSVVGIEPQFNSNGRFLYFSLLSQREQVLTHKSGGAQGGINQEDVRNLVITAPPLPEQAAIAEFLDRETGKIDELVAKQRRLMELLKEKRQAVISHAVTKGLNPHAPMKPSGIEWLGDVPEGWEVGKLGYSCKLRGGFAFAASDFGTEGIVVVKMNNLKRGRLDLSEAARIPETSCNKSVALCDGDLVWGMSGSTGETGSLGNFARVQSADLPCQLNQRVGRFVADSSKLDLTFLEQVIQTPYFYEQIMLLVTGTAQYNVSSEQVQSCIFARPPLSEQAAIIEFLDTELAKFDTLTAEAQRAIDLLQERRTALISAAVTGQIDVRQTPKN